MSGPGLACTAGRLLFARANVPTIIRNSIQTRYLRYHMRLFRDKLPKYKRDPGKLPHLTELLTQKESPPDLECFRKMKLEKLEVYRAYIGKTTVLLDGLLNPDTDDGDKLLRVIDENLDAMTSFYLGVSFEALDDLIRAGLCQADTVLHAPEFRRLCSKTLFKLRYFDCDEVVKLIKCLAIVKLPSNSLLIQATYKMAQHLINDFCPNELEIVIDSMANLNQIEDCRHRLLED